MPSPKTSRPTLVTIATSAPSLAAITAWLAPLPPYPRWNVRPTSVSPRRGRRGTRASRSTFDEPTTQILGRRVTRHSSLAARTPIRTPAAARARGGASCTRPSEPNRRAPPRRTPAHRRGTEHETADPSGHPPNARRAAAARAAGPASVHTRRPNAAVVVRALRPGGQRRRRETVRQNSCRSAAGYPPRARGTKHAMTRPVDLSAVSAYIEGLIPARDPVLQEMEARARTSAFPSSAPPSASSSTSSPGSGARAASSRWARGSDTPRRGSRWASATTAAAR